MVIQKDLALCVALYEQRSMRGGFDSPRTNFNRLAAILATRKQTMIANVPHISWMYDRRIRNFFTSDPTLGAPVGWSTLNSGT